MKKIIISVAMVWNAAIAIAEGGETLPTGKYMFSAPALYKTEDGTLYEWLCEIEHVDGLWRLRFLNGDRGCFIDFSVSDSGKIRIIGSQVGLGEVGRKVKGSGQLFNGNIASGKMAAISGGGGFLFIQRDRSEWHLRPATEQEILEKMMEGLSGVPNALYRRKLDATPENIEKVLHVGEGHGYSFTDRIKIMQMLHEGNLLYTNDHFVLKRIVTGKAVRIPPISPGAKTEKKHYRSEEELLQIMESFEEDGVDMPPRETSTPDVNIEEVSESVSAVKHEEPVRPKIEDKP
ncbi:MAG TPA: hypothetical protein PLT67_02670 [Kiritimatiellia bacterium]|nr:hypothetical protein [Kiritimatiellia bacterium]HQQ03722.1 hypothetical protein [Kiritimatiellia bacterium]